MLVVAPPAARYEVGEGGVVYEEHLLERVSALENRLARLTDKLEHGLELLLRQARNSYFDHTLIETLIGALDEAGAVKASTIDRLWRERCRRDEEEQTDAARREKLQAEIISHYRGTDAEVFEREVSQGINLLNKKETAQGIRTLERASALTLSNAPLNALLGEHFFKNNKFNLARDYLTRASNSDPAYGNVRLLLALVCADLGDRVSARELLNDFLKRKGESFAARYALGRLLIAEQKWAEALKEFKAALVARPSAEAHYVVGSIYFQLGRDRLAERHLHRAIEIDEEYGAAFYVLGLVFLRRGEKERAHAAFSVACETISTDERYIKLARRMLRGAEIPARPKLFWGEKAAARERIMGDDKRLTAFVRADALSFGKAEESFL
jgi:tetratricopeptide (TPR) repeat protein